MASQPAPTSAVPLTHVCPQCSKVFPRLCDLNKHAKSHTRPYKCKDILCKYRTLGWPTAKELERHNNDKHSASPRIFSCLFPPCPYWSKRESNCKQHMEKAHGWEYVRSKSKGKRSAIHLQPVDPVSSPEERGTDTDRERSPAACSASPPPSAMPPPGLDFTLFGDDQADAIGEDDDLYPGYVGFQTAESYLPWTSPTTRMRNNQSFLEVFNQTYNGDDKTNIAHSTASPETNFMLSGLTSPVAAGGGALAPEDCHFTSGVAIKVEPSPVMAPRNLTPRKRKHEPVGGGYSGQTNQGTISASGKRASSRSRRAGAGQTAPIPSKSQASSKQRDSSGEDSCRKIKRPRPNPSEDFTDTSMPDIFRYAHPHIYDRNQAERYSPCHTVHREISTLVRHLSRPAHRLKVTERAISSFDVDDPDFKHPRAGVCRLCWRTFHDRAAFDAHVSGSCERVSKGKREKWRVLFECFTPLLDSVNSTVPEDTPTSNADDRGERLTDHLGHSLFLYADTGISEEAGTPPTSVPSPTLLEPANFCAPGRVVPADVHHRLQDEHQALRARHQQLEQVAQTLFARQLVHETIRCIQAAADLGLESTAADLPRNELSSAPDGPDRDGLVQHMDSQSTDVDVHGFMDEMEDTRQSLSRMNSGLSTTSRSTIHRVPPSPPPRAAELPGHYGSAVPGEEQPAKSSLWRRPPPTSIPDSGYGTEQRRGSMGDVPATAMVAPQSDVTIGAGALTPPSSRGVDEEDRNSSSHHHHHQQQQRHYHHRSHFRQQPQQQQPGFLTDSDMADYGDDSYNLFYQDNNLSQSRSSPPGFTFDFNSQVE